ncbi:sorbosone dehydrogenase family protein [Conexibacter sp. CPCC 206217]|uniref:PQQ-dependent sugar dehydrogenase n=1 Tax=Conexibacter sp. CPCC 206217 TaxID=3064574 RepID=UPI00271FA01E|nr:PQQ-dependent sugar dehydrogenase [Conexibacter sp. CPCC 206217]MDO8209486.1 PQQ-dependent sugar dehydrogenase [Conexibacter sp. CPCC 206217]
MVALGFLLTACGDTPASQTTTAAREDGGGQTTSAQAAPAARSGVRLTRIGSFDGPVYVTQAPGDRSRLFVVEQEGRIRVIRNGRTLKAPFLDLTDRVRSGGEQGLLSVAFAPDYQRSGRFYVDYTDRDGDTRVVEFRRGATPDRANRGSARQVLFQDQPESNHNGGLLLFGPDDKLYIGFGDGGGGYDHHGPIGNGQNLRTWLGKLLRIDPRASGGRPYSVPADNPFVGRAGVRPEIWSWGLRNPWRFSFDRSTGDLTIGDVGQDRIEEVDFVSAGRAPGPGAGVNFGWRAWEGTSRNDRRQSPRGVVFPVLEYNHDDGGCSVTGGYVVRDPRLPALDGRYVYADYCQTPLRSARLQVGRATDARPLGLDVPGVTSFGEDLAGRVYVVAQSGPVYRLDPR